VRRRKRKPKGIAVQKFEEGNLGEKLLSTRSLLSEATSADCAWIVDVRTSGRRERERASVFPQAQQFRLPEEKCLAFHRKLLLPGFSTVGIPGFRRYQMMYKIVSCTEC